MSTYYEYRDIKVMIAHRLMKLEGWKVYGYKEDQSDSMTDYYDPANWGGMAEKNGYILVVNRNYASKETEVKKYNYDNIPYNATDSRQIEKLNAMTVERGASEQEEQTAKEKIELLQEKLNNSVQEQQKYIVTGIIPKHQANPPRCNWHIEKDDIIIAKGSGLLKFASIYSEEIYPNNRHSGYDVDVEKLANEYIQEGYYTDYEKALQNAQSHKNNMLEKKKLHDKFNALIKKFDSTCGGMLGEGELITYEKVTVTEYKKENKVIETTDGSIKEGQCFILKASFNYGCYKGLVYRIHETEYNGTKHYYAYKLNKKLTKECTGKSTQSNHWSAFGDRFSNWIEKGLISFCNIEEVSTPYEVEKVVKTVNKDTKQEGNKSSQATTKTEQTEQQDVNIKDLDYSIIEDYDTRDNSKLYVVKIKQRLEFDDYIKVNKQVKKLGGYYSKFKKGFIFRTDPTELLTA